MREKEPKRKKGLKKVAAQKGAKKAKVSARAQKAPVKKVKVKAKKKVKVKAEVKKKVKVKKKERVLPKPKKKVVVKKVAEKPKKKVKAKKVALPKKPVPRKPKKVLPPVIEEKYPPLPVEILPEEYKEDSITLMTIDPKGLFAYWEVKEDTIARYPGNLTIRVYDVTGVDFDGTNANSFFDMPVSQRVGSSYMDATPEREFIVDIGIIDPAGVFTMVARSNKVSTPREGVAEEGVLPKDFYDTGLPIGY